jgi:hypothetical protein
MCGEYNLLLRYASSATIFATVNSDLEKAVCDYILDYKEYVESESRISSFRPSIVGLDPMITKVIWSCHKAQPLDYNQHSVSLTTYDLAQDCVKFGVLADRFLKCKKIYSTKSCVKTYKTLLKKCLSSPSSLLVPKLHIYYVWRAHMDNHPAYVRSAVNKHGYILNHDYDMIEQLMEWSKEFEFEEKAFEFPNSD